MYIVYRRATDVQHTPHKAYTHAHTYPPPLGHDARGGSVGASRVVVVVVVVAFFAQLFEK